MKSLLLALLLLGSSLYGSMFYPFEYAPYWREGGIDALYWLSIVCPVELGFESRIIDPGRTRHASLRTNPEWGARFYAGLGNCWGHVRISYLIFNPTQSGRDRQNRGFNPPVVYHIPGTNWSEAQARRRITYQHAEFLAGKYWERGCRISVEMTAQARYVDIKYNLLVRAKSPLERGQWQQKSVFTGMGPGFGAAGAYSLFEGLQLKGSLSCLGLIGKRRTPKFEQSSTTQVPTTIITRFDSEVAIVPALTGQTAVEWLWDFPCRGGFRLIFNVAMDWEYYFHPLSYVIDPVSTTDRVCQNIGFAGPSVSIRIHF